MKKIYVASSWRNGLQPGVVKRLREEGYEVYDFRNPAPGDHGFQWSQIDPNWKQWTPELFRNALFHPIAETGYEKDMMALTHCDACVLLMPCGRSAHLEAGYARGLGRKLYILVPEDSEPELMYMMASTICTDLDELVETMKIAKF